MQSRESILGQNLHARLEPTTALINNLIGERNVTQKWEVGMTYLFLILHDDVLSINTYIFFLQKGELSNFQYLVRNFDLYKLPRHSY